MRLASLSVLIAVVALPSLALAQQLVPPPPPPLPVPVPVVEVPAAAAPRYPAPGEVGPVPVAPPPPSVAVPPAAIGLQVRVTFEAKDPNDEYMVKIDDEGQPPMATPCEMWISPGKHRVSVTGAAKFVGQINLPAGTSSSVTIEQRNSGLMALGIVSTVVAGIGVAMLVVEVAVVVLVVMALGGGGELTGGGRGGSASDDPLGTFAVIGVAAAVTGGVGMGLGYGLAGRNRLKVRSDDPRQGAATLDPQLLSFGVSPTHNGAMIGATFAF